MPAAPLLHAGVLTTEVLVSESASSGTLTCGLKPPVFRWLALWGALAAAAAAAAVDG